MSNIEITMAVFMVAFIVCLVCGVLSVVASFFYANGVTDFFGLVGLFAFMVMVVSMVVGYVMLTSLYIGWSSI
jgi:hypothetical protein